MSSLTNSKVDFMNFVMLAGLRLMYARLDEAPQDAAAAADDQRVAADEPQGSITAWAV